MAQTEGPAWLGNHGVAPLSQLGTQTPSAWWLTVGGQQLALPIMEPSGLSGPQ